MLDGVLDAHNKGVGTVAEARGVTGKRAAPPDTPRSHTCFENAGKGCLVCRNQSGKKKSSFTVQKQGLGGYARSMFWCV